MRCDSISLRIGQLGIPHPNTRYMCELRRARPMQSFSDVSKKLLQTKYVGIYNPICSVCHDVTTDKHRQSPLVCPYLLAICCHHPPAKHTTLHQQRAQPDSYFPPEIILARIWMEFSTVELPNPLKYVRHCKLPKRQTSRTSYTT